MSDCHMRVLGISPGIEPRLPELEAWSLSHWTIREVPEDYFLVKVSLIQFGKTEGQFSSYYIGAFPPKIVI